MSFIHVGYGNIVNDEKVKAVIRPNTQCGKRYLKAAKTQKCYIDAALGRGLRALIIMDDGYVMGSAITLRTLIKRFNGDEHNDVTEADEGPIIGRDAEGNDEEEREEEDTEDEAD